MKDVEHPCASCAHKGKPFHFVKCPGLRKVIEPELCSAIATSPARKAVSALREYRKATRFKLI